MVYIKRSDLEELCTGIFEAMGIPRNEALDSARILSAADARGIQSHGVARIRRYVNGIKAGLIKGDIKPAIMHETPISLVLDGGGAMGLSLSKTTMEKVIAKAKDHGIGVASIRDSNHFGIAGYYSEMAAREGMIGVAMTNTAALGVPTFAREAAFGTNPIAFSAPALDGRMFTLDMATTAVTRGKIEVYQRENKALPPGWAVGTDGHATSDPVKLLDDMLYQRGGGLLPLGGEGEMNAGYKGYGLGVLVDIMTALCSGGTFGRAVKDTEITAARVCHFFMALRLDIFRPPEEFKKDMSSLMADLNSLTPAEGAERVYYAGQKEHEAEAACAVRGVPLAQGVWDNLTATARELGIALPALV